MKVLFCDFDGVINSRRTVVAGDGYPHSFDVPDAGRFDWTAVGLIRKLCEETGASICLSSTWRLTNSVEECAHALSLPIFDKTPYIGGPRGREIKEWLDQHPDVTTYAIVDDNADMLVEQLNYFVKTCEKNGLSFENYEELKRILGVEAKVAA